MKGYGAKTVANTVTMSEEPRELIQPSDEASSDVQTSDIQRLLGLLNSQQEAHRTAAAEATARNAQLVTDILAESRSQAAAARQQAETQAAAARQQAETQLAESRKQAEESRQEARESRQQFYELFAQMTTNKLPSTNVEPDVPATNISAEQETRKSTTEPQVKAEVDQPKQEQRAVAPIQAMTGKRSVAPIKNNQVAETKQVGPTRPHSYATANATPNITVLKRAERKQDGQTRPAEETKHDGQTRPESYAKVAAAPTVATSTPDVKQDTSERTKTTPADLPYEESAEKQLTYQGKPVNAPQLAIWAGEPCSKFKKKYDTYSIAIRAGTKSKPKSVVNLCVPGLICRVMDKLAIEDESDLTHDLLWEAIQLEASKWDESVVKSSPLIERLGNALKSAKDPFGGKFTSYDTHRGEQFMHLYSNLGHETIRAEFTGSQDDRRQVHQLLSGHTYPSWLEMTYEATINDNIELAQLPNSLSGMFTYLDELVDALPTNTRRSLDRVNESHKKTATKDDWVDPKKKKDKERKNGRDLRDKKKARRERYRRGRGRDRGGGRGGDQAGDNNHGTPDVQDKDSETDTEDDKSEVSNDPPPHKQLFCKYCKSDRHNIRTCNKIEQGEIACYKCGDLGHMSYNCPTPSDDDSTTT
jgi:hypothetical protein